MNIIMAIIGVLLTFTIMVICGQIIVYKGEFKMDKWIALIGCTVLLAGIAIYAFCIYG